MKRTIFKNKLLLFLVLSLLHHTLI